MGQSRVGATRHQPWPWYTFLMVGCVGVSLWSCSGSEGDDDASGTPEPEATESSGTDTNAPTPGEEDGPYTPEQASVVFRVDPAGFGENVYTTIQAAINATTTFTRIEVVEGTYDEIIDYGAQDIQLVALGSPAKTVLKATACTTSSPCPVVSIRQGQTGSTLLEGFTIEGGTGAPCNPDGALTDLPSTGFTCGGSVVIEGSTPWLKGLTLKGGQANIGGGIFITGEQEQMPFLQNVSIRNSAAAVSDTFEGGNGGGLAVLGSSPWLRNVRIRSNQAGSQGGGIFFKQGGQIRMWNVELSTNGAPVGGGMVLTQGAVDAAFLVSAGNRSSVEGGGLYIGTAGSIYLLGSQFYLNNCDDATGGDEIHVDDLSGSVIYSYGGIHSQGDEVLGGVVANIEFPEGAYYAWDPRFNDPEGGDFRLDAQSGAIDNGPPEYLAARDPDGTLADVGAFASSYADDWDLDNDGSSAPWSLRSSGTEQEWDCDDGNPDLHPGALEICDGYDNNCDGVMTDEADKDGDGWRKCSVPPDCNESDYNINPGQSEGLVADEIDNDCNGIVDDGALDSDQDGDGYCEIEGPNCPLGGGDCDDGDQADTAGIAQFIHPGAEESCDGVDTNCDDVVSPDEDDADGDTFRICGGDCDDNNVERHPELVDYPGNGIDEDCDGWDSGAVGIRFGQGTRSVVLSCDQGVAGDRPPVEILMGILLVWTNRRRSIAPDLPR